MYLRFIYNVLLSLFLLLVGSCATGPDPDVPDLAQGEWQKSTLAGKHVNELEFQSDKVYAATNSGLFHLERENESWDGIGLENGKIMSVEVFSEQELLAPVYFSQIDSSAIVKTNNSGETWISVPNNFGGDQKSIPHIIISHPENPSVLYARGLGNVAKSTDGGRNWESVYLFWDAWLTARFIKINSRNPDIVWAGGATAIFTSHLVKSTDGGETWTRVDPVEDNVEATCYDVAFTEDEDRVLVGTSGGIRKTTDGGQSWHTAFDQAGIYTLTHSARNPAIIYASGVNAQGTLFFIASTDFGDTWQTVEYANSPDEIYINDMVSVMAEDREVLYLGTNKGVYSYVFEDD